MFRKFIEHVETIMSVIGFASFWLGAGAALTLWRLPTTPAAETVAIERRACSGTFVIIGIPYKGQPQWLDDHIYWLETEGDRYKAAKTTETYVVAQAEHKVSTPSYGCAAVLRVPDGYTIESHSAFRIIGSGTSELHDELDIAVPSGDLREIRLRIPESNAGDSVFVLFRLGATSGRKLSGGDIGDLISSRFE